MEKESIKKITVAYGGFFDGAEKRTLTHEGEKISVEREFFNGASDDGRTLYKGKTWESLLNELAGLHINEWDEDYDDSDVADGTQWSFDIEYSDGKEKHSSGSNKFPDNFDDFLRVMEIEK